MKFSRGFLILFLELTLAACSNGNKSTPNTPINRTSGNGRGVVNGTAPVDPRLQKAAPSGQPPQVQTSGGYATYPWGELDAPQTGNINWGSQTNGFQSKPSQLTDDIVRWFLTTNWDPETVGATTAPVDPTFQFNCASPGAPVPQPNQICTMRVQMPLGLSQSLSSAMASGGTIPITNGALGIVVYDSFVNEPNSNGTPMVPIQVNLTLASDYQANFISGTGFTAGFKDPDGFPLLGYVTVSAQITNNTINGRLDFYNSNDYSGDNNGAQGMLGTFSINTCYVFQQNCN